MYLYCRIQQDLDCLGEVIQFHDPSMARSMRNWVRKNRTGLAVSYDLGGEPDTAKSSNDGKEDCGPSSEGER